MQTWLRPVASHPQFCDPRVPLQKSNLSEKSRAHKNKIGPPPQTQNTPPLKRGILWKWVFLHQERIFPGVHKIRGAISGPRIADTNFTDTRIFSENQENDIP